MARYPALTLVVLSLVAGASANAQTMQEKCAIIIDSSPALCKHRSIAAKAQQIYDLNHELALMRMMGATAMPPSEISNPMLTEKQFALQRISQAMRWRQPSRLHRGKTQCADQKAFRREEGGKPFGSEPRGLSPRTGRADAGGKTLISLLPGADGKSRSA
jgi:hypothetical protein